MRRAVRLDIQSRASWVLRFLGGLVFGRRDDDVSSKIFVCSQLPGAQDVNLISPS